MVQSNTPDITPAIKAGYKLLSNPNIAVPVTDIEALSTLKLILMRVLKGDLIIVSPDLVNKN